MHLSVPEQFPLLYFGFLFLSLQCLISALTQGGQAGHLFRLTSSVVLWGGKNTANKYHWCVGGVLTLCGPYYICPNLQWHVLSESTLFKLQVALQEYCPKRTLHFCALPRSKWLSFKFSDTLQGHRLGWACILCLSHVRVAQAIRRLVSSLFQVGHVS